MPVNETKNNIFNSYWNYACEHSRLFQEWSMEESRRVKIDRYWNSLSKFRKPKYTKLFALAKTILSLNRRNFVPE